MLRQALLGTTAAILGATGLWALTAPQGAAAEIKPGGALDITITGFARFRATGGDLAEARLNKSSSPSTSDQLDFSNDTEVHILARGRDERTGLEYGGTVEFEADTNRLDNTDETWIFVRGGFGEFRFGDEDGAGENSAVGAQTTAAGTGGLDGSVVDTFAGGPTYKLFNTDDATKIRYYTPDVAGFTLGLSYTPQQAAINSGADNGDALANTDAEAENFVEGALVYSGAFGGAGVLASLTAAYCQLNKKNASAIEGVTVDESDCQGVYGGAVVDIFGIKVGGGWGGQKVGNTRKDFYNVGAGVALGPTNVSINYGQVYDSNNLVVNGNEVDKPWNLVLSADVPILPGLVLAGDVGWFNNDVGSGPDKGSDDGWQAIGRLGLAF